MDSKVLDCIDQALRYLSIREHNKKELCLKLKYKGFDNSQIEKTTEFLVQSGDLNEERYVESFICSSNKRHPEGKTVIFQRLISKGADRAVSQMVLNRIYTDEYIFSLVNEAKKVFRKKILKSNSSVTEKDLEKNLKALLIKAGFNLSKIQNFD